jgi:hypothetical protein
MSSVLSNDCNTPLETGNPKMFSLIIWVKNNTPYCLVSPDEKRLMNHLVKAYEKELGTSELQFLLINGVPLLFQPNVPKFALEQSGVSLELPISERLTNVLKKALPHQIAVDWLRQD